MIRGSVALPAGVFQGGGTVELKLTQAAMPGDKIAVTIEPAGGTTQADDDADRHEPVG